MDFGGGERYGLVVTYFPCQRVVLKNDNMYWYQNTIKKSIAARVIVNNIALLY